MRTNVLLSYLLQAQYWHDPLAEEEYLENSLYLADINNQGNLWLQKEMALPPLPGANKNSSYIAALTQLSNLVLVKFSSDTVDVKHCSSV